MGIAHCGLIAFLADAAVTFAAGSVAGETARTVDLTINYLRPAVAASSRREPMSFTPDPGW